MASEPNRFSIGPLKTRKEIRDSSRIFVAKLRFDKAEKKESRRRGERSTEEKREGCVTERNKEGRRKREKKEKKKRGMGATPLKYQGKFLGPASSVTPYFYSSSQFVPFLFRAAVSSVIFLTRFNFSYMSSSSLSLSLSFLLLPTCRFYLFFTIIREVSNSERSSHFSVFVRDICSL